MKQIHPYQQTYSPVLAKIINISFDKPIRDTFHNVVPMSMKAIGNRAPKCTGINERYIS